MHLALLKPALQAWGGWGERPNQVLTHLALLRSALQALGGVSGLGRVFGLCSACGCDSGLKDRFPVAQGAAILMSPFAEVIVQTSVQRNRPPMGQRPDTTWLRATPEGLGSKLPKLFLNSQPMHSPITTGGSGWLLFASRKR